MVIRRIVTLGQSVNHKHPRWLARLGIGILATAFVASSALAQPTFIFLADQGGADDEPNQKDLTSQAAAFDGALFYSAWKWDDTSLSGKNTGDACSLFDSDGDGFVNYAVCVTVGGNPAEELSERVYSCGDARADRCTNPIVLLGSRAPTDDGWCTVALADATFQDPPAQDLQATCNISKIAVELNISALNGANLINTCSYPSQEPNSDPSDCVVEINEIDTSLSTLPIVTWSATLNDTATLTPSSATGSVVFTLWSDPNCTNSVWVSGPVNLVGGSASTVNVAGAPLGGKVITAATVNVDGIYYWTVVYTPDSPAFNPSSSPCGAETVTIDASVIGFPAPPSP